MFGSYLKISSLAAGTIGDLPFLTISRQAWWGTVAILVPESGVVHFQANKAGIVFIGRVRRAFLSRMIFPATSAEISGIVILTIPEIL